MKLKCFLKPMLQLFIIQITIINFNFNYATYITKSHDPLAVTELQQHFIDPHRNDTAIPLENRPYKRLIFAALLPSHELDNKNDCILPKVLSVLELAIHHVQRMGFAHNARIDVTLISRDTNCSSVHGPLGFFEIYMQQPEINAVWGLPCEYVLAPISRYAGVWQIPVFTSAGNAADFQHKATTYHTLTRLKGAQANNLGNAVRAIIDSFNWTRTALIYQNEHTKFKGNSVCFFCMYVVHDKLDEYKASSYQQAFDTEQWKKADIERMLVNLAKQTRIVIMCADPQSIRQIMLTAEELKMIDSGEYVFINIELFSRVPHLTSQPWYDKNDTKENNLRARKAYTAMLTVTPKQPNNDEYTRVSNEFATGQKKAITAAQFKLLATEMEKHPDVANINSIWENTAKLLNAVLIKAIAASKYNYKFHYDEPISAFVTSFFDGVLLYANALNDSIREDPSVLTRPINGTDMVRRMWNRSFMGITGNVTIDANGDRISAYSLLDMNPNTGRFEIVAHFEHNKLEYEPGKVIHWAGDRLEPPLDRPVCGYDGSLCPDNSLPGYAILSIILGAMVVIMSVCFFFGYRHYKSESEINSMAWRVSIDDVIFHNSAGRCFRGSLHSLVKHGSQLTLMSDDMGSLSGDRQIFIPVGLFRGCKTAVKIIDVRNINLTRSLMLELKHMKDLQHEHLVKFYGACLDPDKSFILTEYCPKGSLQDILENDQFQLDWMFKLSLMHDIVRGMHFLHNSDIKSHGNLKSSNCVVDSRFVLKVCDFGLHTLRRTNEDKGSDIENYCNSYAYWSKLLWTAPELLRMENNRPHEGTQKGDVYSFGIIVHEITTRQGPFYLGKLEDEKPPQEIIYLVKNYPHIVQYPFRPQLVDIPNDYKEINTVMQRCWSEDPNERPDFNALKAIIRNINKDNETGNIVDNLLKRMEQYANNLEELVEERTQDYIEEKKKCEKLLYQLLPQSVAAQLISGQPVVAETFDQVTIYFSDIVGFTAISAESTPMQVVQFLNDLYTCFDSIVENFDVYKVETIGDAYMVVSGLPIRNGNQHAREIARMALALLEAVHNFKIHHRQDDRLKLRIGLHTGACVAGVVGLKMPRYCLFGDTVNTASRMESNGEALKIHISEKTKVALDEFGTFITTRRGYVPMKGKGEMLTYWLEGEVQKVESPISPHKLMLSRRSSLKQVPRYGLFNKQTSDFAAQLLTPYQLQAQTQQQQQLQQHQQQMFDSRQNSPNLRVKRKISSSSPKLNGSDYKTDDLYNYLEASSRGMPMQTIKAPANDIYSSRSLRDDPKEGCWEMANFRLPLSGTLKSHANAKHSYTQLTSTLSNSNLLGLLQPATSRLRLKKSPTTTSLMNASETGSLNSTNRAKYNANQSAEETQHLVSSRVYEEEEGDAATEEIEQELDTATKGIRNPAIILTHSDLNGVNSSYNHNSLVDSSHQQQQQQQQQPQLYAAAPQITNLDNSNTSTSQYQNKVKVNNSKNFEQLRNSSNGFEEQSALTAAKNQKPLLDNEESTREAMTANHKHHNNHHQATVNAVAQPLLAKINS